MASRDSERAAHRGLEGAKSALPLLLRSKHGQVGIADELLRGSALRRADGPADADSDVEGVASDPEGGAEGFEERRRARGERRGVARVRQHDGELVATEPRQDRIGSEPRRQSNRQGLEQRIARAVPPTVVHLLEPVEVQHEDADGVSGRQPGIERLLEAGAVRQSGQEVMMGQLDQTLVARPPFGDVPQDRAEAEAGAVPPHRERELGGKLTAVAAAGHDLDRSTGQTRGLVAGHPRHAGLVAGTESLRNDQIDVRAQQFADTVAEEGCGGRVRKGDAAPLVAGDEGIGGGPSQTEGTRNFRYGVIQVALVRRKTICCDLNHRTSSPNGVRKP